MPHSIRRLLSWLLAVTLVILLSPPRGEAALQGVYFTAANEQLLELNSSTMPFWSGDTLYVSSNVFSKTDLGLNYVRNNKMGLAVLYTSRTDLRFDLTHQTVYDKQGVSYPGRAIERGGVIFLPLNLVCSYFGLTWSYTETATAPLIRVRSSSAILDDRTFIDAATDSMNSRYTAYEKWVEANTPIAPPAVEQTPPPVHAAEGQKIHLLIECRSAADTLAAMALLGEAQATFLLDLEQMENGDLLRALTANGHEIALLTTAQTAAELEAEVSAARSRLWQAACGWLQLVWYEGNDSLDQVLEDIGCHRVTAMLDRSDSGLANTSRVTSLMTSIGRYRTDVTIFLGNDSGCLGGLKSLVRELLDAQYQVCAWRMTH